MIVVDNLIYVWVAGERIRGIAVEPREPAFARRVRHRSEARQMRLEKVELTRWSLCWVNVMPKPVSVMPIFPFATS